MNTKFILFISLVVLVFFGSVAYLSSTGGETGRLKSVAQHHITVLLDLSDRIGSKKGGTTQVNRDLQDIKTVVDVFKQQVKRNYYVNSRDQLAVVVSRQKGSDPAAQSTNQADFTINMAALPINGKQHKFVEALTDTLFKQTGRLYSQVQAQEATKGFTGADIWSFFESELPLYLMTGKKAPQDSIIQTLVIITDGYNDFSEAVLKTRPFNGNRTSYGQVRRLAAKPEPLSTFDKGNYGMMSSQKYPDLRVVVLELSPAGNNSFHEQLIRGYWNKWFQEMGIPSEHYKLLLNNTPPSNTENALVEVMTAPNKQSQPLAAAK